MALFPGENLVPEQTSENEASPGVGTWEVAIRDGSDVAAAFRDPAFPPARAPRQLPPPPHLPRLPDQPFQPPASALAQAGAWARNQMIVNPPHQALVSRRRGQDDLGTKLLLRKKPVNNMRKGLLRTGGEKSLQPKNDRRREWWCRVPKKRAKASLLQKSAKESLLHKKVRRSRSKN